MKLPRAVAIGPESAHAATAHLAPPTPPGGADKATAAAPARSRRRPGGDDEAGSARGGTGAGAFVCRTCSRRFPSFQALGGHRTGHTRRHALPRPQKPARAAHECAVCGLEFAMGQALGGHMRRHKLPDAEARVDQAVEVVDGRQEEDDTLLDLNSAPLEEYRGGDRAEGCSSGSGSGSGSEPRLLNLLV